MKKAKILVPAIAALVLSSAAAVTGTVAWFKSTTTADVKGTGLTVVNTSAGNLSYSLTAGHGTTLAGGETGSVTHSKLVDGSVDMTQATPVVYGQTDAAATNFEVVDAPYTGPASTQRATQFKITFTYKFFAGAGISSVNLYLNTVNSKITTSGDVTIEGDEYTILPALRIGFKTTAGYKVWAPFHEATTLDYINKAGAHSAGQYATENIIKGSVATPTNSTTVASAASNLIGTITANPGFASSSETDEQTLDVNVYTWIEGEDAACDNASTLFKDLKHVLNFATVDNLTAAKN